jgi:hypothetical protein
MSKEMYASIRQLSSIMLACFFFAVLQCTTLQTTGTGGTGSETVIGKIIHEDGTPATQTVVELYPSDFDPVSNATPSNICTDTTDSDGCYTIKLTSLTVKKYSLHASNLAMRTRTIIPNVDISMSGESTFVVVSSLHKTGSVKVIFSDSMITDNSYIYIPGTTYFSYAKNGYAIIDSVPAQTISKVHYKSKIDVSVQKILAETIDVKPGITTFITFSGSAYSRKIFLNTTPEGANVTENVLGFPLLIRLSGSNFDFNQAGTDGSDLRFTKADCTPIPFEIERWDAAAQLAEIWVKVDTIYGNDSSHFFVMYWGEPATIIALNNVNVFDTVNGFRGVWHLSEEAAGAGTIGLYKDATGRSNGDDYISETDRSGMIGYGHAFDGVDDFIPLNSPVTNFLKGDVTIALWVSIHDSGGTIMSKLDTMTSWSEGGASLYFGDGTNTYHAAGLNGTRPSFVGHSDDYAIAGQSIVQDVWSYLVYTWKWNGDSTGTARFYIDGKETTLSRDSLTIRVDENSNATVRIGQPNNNESYSYFKGSMDELEISEVVRSADWIKLCYMNQKNDGLFVKY